MWVSGLIELLRSFGGVLYYLQEDRLSGDELVFQDHHVLEVISCPHLYFAALEVIQLLIFLPITQSPNKLTEGFNLWLEFD